MDNNPLVPRTDWGSAVEAFAEEVSAAPQVILCADCVRLLGMTTPPSQIIVYDGKSYCLDHLPPARGSINDSQ